MSYRWNICKKLEVLKGKELKMGQLLKMIEEIVHIKEAQSFYDNIFKDINQISFITIPRVYEVEDENRICYDFGEDDNQVFIDYEIVKENQDNYMLDHVKVTEVWT